MSAICIAHIWTPATHDGTPRFTIRAKAEPAMPVRCCECDAEAWVTRDKWDSMREADEAREPR